jgi:hypothetical protein
MLSAGEEESTTVSDSPGVVVLEDAVVAVAVCPLEDKALGVEVNKQIGGERDHYHCPVDDDNQSSDNGRNDKI